MEFRYLEIRYSCSHASKILSLSSFIFNRICDFLWLLQKHSQRCHTCKSGRMCYVTLQVGYSWTSFTSNSTNTQSEVSLRLGTYSSITSLQERSVSEESYSFITYLSYLLFAPLYLAGPVISFNAFASQVLHNPSSLCLWLFALAISYNKVSTIRGLKNFFQTP